MKKLLASLLLFCCTLTVAAQSTDKRCFELRIYYCHPGRLDALIERFTNHTTKLFEQHGMQNIGYWVPVDNKENALYYVLAYPSRQARDSSWKAFNEDNNWKTVRTNSEASGKIVDRVTSTFMETTNFTPAITASGGTNNRLFELRTYTCHANKLPNLLQRFHNHTCQLFAAAGMTNIAYWTGLPQGTDQPKLIYLLAHDNEAAAKKSWETFRANPDWIKVRDASEAAGPIVEAIGTLKLKPLPFSSIR